MSIPRTLSSVATPRVATWRCSLPALRRALDSTGCVPVGRAPTSLRLLIGTAFRICRFCSRGKT